MHVPNHCDNPALFFANIGSRYVFAPHNGQIYRLGHRVSENGAATGQLSAICRSLACRPVESVQLGYSEEAVSHAVDSQLGHLTLGVTQECNFRCDYCVYSGEFGQLRTHARKSMTEAMAIEAADYFLAHSSQARKDLYCTFYGGEPFLNFPVIRKTVHYLSGALKDRIHFSITTNGSLLDTEIRRFLIDNGIYLSISIDGDHNNHDRHRRYIDGRPTFEHVVSGIEQLRLENEDYFNLYVTFAVTITADSDYRILDEFFSNYRNNVKVSGVMFYGSKGIRPVRGNTRNISLMIDKFTEGCLSHAFDHPESRLPYQFAAAVISRGLRTIHNRRVTDTRLFDETYSLTRHCIPGATKLFVSPDGTFYPCEKLDAYRHLSIGNLRHGVDKAKVMQCLQEYVAMRNSRCRNCFLLDICDYCFQSASNGESWDEEKMDLHCTYAREEYARVFELYTEILEKDGSAFDFLDHQPVRAN